jgi:hypothetical protein
VRRVERRDISPGLNDLFDFLRSRRDIGIEAFVLALDDADKRDTNSPTHCANALDPLDPYADGAVSLCDTRKNGDDRRLVKRGSRIGLHRNDQSSAQSV